MFFLGAVGGFSSSLEALHRSRGVKLLDFLRNSEFFPNRTIFEPFIIKTWTGSGFTKKPGYGSGFNESGIFESLEKINSRFESAATYRLMAPRGLPSSLIINITNSCVYNRYSNAYFNCYPTEIRKQCIQMCKIILMHSSWQHK